MGNFAMSQNQVLAAPEKLLFYLEVKRAVEQDHDERYFRYCEDELLESSEYEV